MDLLSFARKYKKTIIEYRVRHFKNCFQKVVLKAGKLLGNKIADAMTKRNDDNSARKKGWNIKQIKTSIFINMEHYKISKLLIDSTVSKFVTKNGSK